MLVLIIHVVVIRWSIVVAVVFCFVVDYGFGYSFCQLLAVDAVAWFP